MPTLSQSKINRIRDRASQAYVAGQPYTAYQILRDNGLEILWPTFLRTALTWSGERYRRAMTHERNRP